MKRMKIWSVFLIAIITISGCANTKETNSIETESSTIEDVNVEKTKTISKETVDSETPSPEKKDIDSMIIEKTDEELNLKTYNYSVEDRTVCDDGNDIFGSVIFDYTDLAYVTTAKVPIYASNGIKMGYVKENVDIIVLGIYENWCKFDLDGENKYARLSDIEANSITMDERDAMTEEANKQEETTVKTEVPVENAPMEQPVVETPTVNEPVEQPVEVPVESDKYTPEEAVAVYRSLMEAGGMTWNPGLKDVSSWGTGWIELQKGMPEWCAETNLESAAIGSHGGNSWTQFYFEVTGSDEEAVYITEWHN